MALVSILLLAVPVLALTPTAEARTIYCTDLKSPSCPGFLCVDTSLDGSIEEGEDECIDFYCGVAGCCPITTGCCGAPCPPPPATSTSPTCTGYVNVGGTKQRTCVDPDAAPECGAWTEGWSTLGYYRACYGADTGNIPCNEIWCLHGVSAAAPTPSWLGVCTEKTIGGTPVAVTVEYGTGVGCVGATYTTCRLSYYPGEPNTPVWVCTEKRIV